MNAGSSNELLQAEGSCGFRLQAEVPGTRYAIGAPMAHPYPPHWKHCPYVGRIYYSLTYVTVGRREVFTNADAVDLVHAQFLRVTWSWP